MLLSILDLDKMTVEHIMVPRSEIYAIDINDDWKTILRQLAHCAHTKILLYRDNIDDVVGFLHARDALRLMARISSTSRACCGRWTDLLHPGGTPLNVQLAKFQRNKERIGLIVDEYGDIQGLITLDDILEEIVGDFTTSMTPAPSDEIHPSRTAPSWWRLRQHPRAEQGDELATAHRRAQNAQWCHPGIPGGDPQPNISLRLAGYPIEILEVENNMVKMARIMPDLYRNESGFED